MTSSGKSNHYAMTEHNYWCLSKNIILCKKHYSSTCLTCLISNSFLGHLIFTHLFQYFQWIVYITHMYDEMESNWDRLSNYIPCKLYLTYYLLHLLNKKTLVSMVYNIIKYQHLSLSLCSHGHLRVCIGQWNRKGLKRDDIAKIDDQKKKKNWLWPIDSWWEKTVY